MATRITRFQLLAFVILAVMIGAGSYIGIKHYWPVDTVNSNLFYDRQGSTPKLISQGSQTVDLTVSCLVAFVLLYQIGVASKNFGVNRSRLAALGKCLFALMASAICFGTIVVTPILGWFNGLMAGAVCAVTALVLAVPCLALYGALELVKFIVFGSCKLLWKVFVAIMTAAKRMLSSLNPYGHTVPTAA